jgi:integrase
MPVLAECPQCKTKQSVKNKVCSCGKNLDKAKRNNKVRYWIGYRTPTGKQRRELIGTSIDEARKCYAKRTVQKIEKPSILNRPREANMTFESLTKWYMGEEEINGKRYEALKGKAYYPTVGFNLKRFNDVFGNILVGAVQPIDLKNYQAKRQAEGYSPKYIDDHIGSARTMVKAAWENNLIGGEPFKVFRSVKKLLMKNGNARNRALTCDEYERLINYLKGHVKLAVEKAFWTGMRRGEIVNLTWDKVDLHKRLIHLTAEDTKERKAKTVPIAKPLLESLVSLPNRLQKANTDNHVILFRGKPIKGDMRASLETACQKADIPYGRGTVNGFIFHDLRHTFATTARKAGVPRNVIMKIMGHSDGSDMNSRYDTIDAEDMLQAVDKMVSFYEDVTKPLPDQPSSDIPGESDQGLSALNC